MRTSLFQCAEPVSKSPTPGMTYVFVLTLLGSTGSTSSGSFVLLSSTEAYALILPEPSITFASTRASLTFTLGNVLPRLNCCSSYGRRLHVFVASCCTWPLKRLSCTRVH